MLEEARGLGMGGHHSHKALKEEWLTPPHILAALGRFDLDPCAPPPERRPWPMADQHYSLEEDGIKQPWRGRVWLNPPYGAKTGMWLERLANHRNGIALIFARTETEMFFDQVWRQADGLLFLKGRLHFHHSSGLRAEANSGAPSVLVAYGAANMATLQTCGLPGAFMAGWRLQ